MTDKEFVYNYLEKTYEPIIDGYGLMFRDKILQKTCNVDEFKINFYKVIGNWDTDDGTTSYEMCSKWYKQKEESLIKDLLNYLKNCTFELGTADWIVKNSDGYEIKLENLIAEFDGKYSKEFVTHFYSNWYSEKVCEESEKIMNTWM